VLTIAERMAPETALYFPYTLDFRGRIYAQVPFLNPQGHDIAKGLLTFAHGKPIGDGSGPGWLAIHGANVYGFDKASLEERIAWVETHREVILACARDPLGESFWQDADSPWMFLAFCFEWAGYMRDGAAFVSCLPIALDGSCNGIQHFSAMLRDAVGGAAVNLVPGDKPSDIYATVANLTALKLRLLSSTIGGVEAGWAKLWGDFGIDRKITKRPVMVLPYGGTYMACKDYVEDAVLERGPAPIKDRKEFNKATHFLAKQVWSAIGETVIGARECMSWLQSCARLAAKTNLPINWVTPTGLMVQQAYRSTKMQQVKCRLFDKEVKLKLAVETDDIDGSKQVQGIAPNFVHSMDASALVACVNLSVGNGVSSFAMVHDSYGTLAADTDMLGACLRHAFVDMYKENDVLEQFREGIVAMLPPDLKAKVAPCPAKGSLDLDQVLKSDFFFA
jgi:DNA-directed RNA polymerase